VRRRRLARASRTKIYCQAGAFGFSGFSLGEADRRPDAKKPTGNFVGRKCAAWRNPLEWTWIGLSKLLGEAVTMRAHATYDLRPDLTEL
jgi:hypothetical protein